jgi:hypothetical protein
MTPENPMTVREFWRSTSLGPQLALACTLAAGIVNLWSYVGLTWPAAYLVHLAVMALGFALFGRLVQHHRLARKERRARDWPFDREARMRRFITPLPTLLVWGVIAALVYMAGVAIRDSAVFGEGAAEFRDGQEVWVNNGVVVRKTGARFGREPRRVNATRLLRRLAFLRPGHSAVVASNR